MVFPFEEEAYSAPTPFDNHAGSPGLTVYLILFSGTDYYEHKCSISGHLYCSTVIPLMIACGIRTITWVILQHLHIDLNLWQHQCYVHQKQLITSYYGLFTSMVMIYHAIFWNEAHHSELCHNNIDKHDNQKDHTKFGYNVTFGCRIIVIEIFWPLTQYFNWYLRWDRWTPYTIRSLSNKGRSPIVELSRNKAKHHTLTHAYAVHVHMHMDLNTYTIPCAARNRTCVEQWYYYLLKESCTLGCSDV